MIIPGDNKSIEKEDKNKAVILNEKFLQLERVDLIQIHQVTSSFMCLIVEKKKIISCSSQFAP